MSNASGSSGLNDLLANISRLADKLGSLAEEGGELKRTIRFGDEDSDGPSGVFGLHIRTGVSDSGGSNVTVEPFGNVREQDTGDIVVEETREPVVDVYDEEEHVRIVAEMPGVGADDVTLDVTGDVCVLAAATERHRYRKDLLLPRPVASSPAHIHATNGIVDITLPVAPTEGDA
jgi:HSP20 family protein